VFFVFNIQVICTTKTYYVNFAEKSKGTGNDQDTMYVADLLLFLALKLVFMYTYLVWCYRFMLHVLKMVIYIFFYVIWLRNYDFDILYL